VGFLKDQFVPKKQHLLTPNTLKQSENIEKYEENSDKEKIAFI